MMTESEFREVIYSEWPIEGTEASELAFSLLEQALALYPQSAALWCMKGDLIQLGPDDNKYALSDALACYHRALGIDPTFAKAHESIGYYHDAVMDDPQTAEPSFQAALRYGGGEHSYAGLARVMAQLGRRHDALALLRASSCPFATSPAVEEIRAEIVDGTWCGENRDGDV